MPISHSFRESVIEMQQEGQYTVPELQQAILLAFEDPACPPSPRLLCDMRNADVFAERTRSETRAIAEFLIHQGPRFGGKLAMVVSSDLAFGLLRQGAVDTEEGGVNAVVFRDLQEARAWIREG